MSFLEVMISMMLLSFVLLGLNATQLFALREARSDYDFAVAMQNEIDKYAAD